MRDKGNDRADVRHVLVQEHLLNPAVLAEELVKTPCVRSAIAVMAVGIRGPPVRHAMALAKSSIG